MLPSEIRVSVPDVSTSNVRTYGFSCWRSSGLELHIKSILCCACCVKRKSCRCGKAEINHCLSSLSPHFSSSPYECVLCMVSGLMYGICTIYMLTANACVYVFFYYLSHAGKLALLGAICSGFCGVGLTGTLCWQRWRILTSVLAGGPSALFHIKSFQHWGGICFLLTFL